MSKRTLSERRERRQLLLTKLNEELQGQYMIGAMCRSDSMLKMVTINVARIRRNITRLNKLSDL